MSDIDKKLDDILQHHGVKGMKWGVRRDTRATRKRYNSYNKGMRLIDRSRLKKMTSAEARKKYLDDKDQKWIAKVKDDKNIQKVAKRTTKEMKRVNKDLKEEFGGKGLKGDAKRAMDGRLNAAYNKAMKEAYNEVVADHTFAVYKLSPSRVREVDITPNPDGTFKATIVERHNPKLTKQRAAIEKGVKKTIKREAKRAEKESLTHADSTDDSTDDVTDLDGMVFIILPDEDGFPDRVIPPFDFEDGEEDVQHSGIKGMRWGVRRDRNRPGGADGKEESTKVKDNRGKVRKQLDSWKRERDWHKVLKEMDKLNTKDIKAVTKRVELENDLKTLSKTKGVGTNKDKSDYLRRENMSDAELNRKVVRLRAKKSLHKAVKDASKEQREFGEKVVQIASSVGVKYALNRGNITPKDLFLEANKARKNPKESYKNAKEEAQKELQKRIMVKLQSRP